jgi:hypothetical protein
MMAHDDCYDTANKYCACIEFQPSGHLRHGFHSSQLIEYSLEPNPEAKNVPNAPPQKFAIAFSTADVVILGWRLDLIVNNLRDNQLASVRVLPQRFAQLEGNFSFPSARLKNLPILFHDFDH